MHAEVKSMLETNLAAVLKRSAAIQIEAEQLQTVANELRALLNDKRSISVKVDGMGCMRAALAPGAILLPAEAVKRLAQEFGVSNSALRACGGIASTEKVSDSQQKDT